LGGGWQISAGDFADYLGPARLAFAALSSAWVLADSRRRTNRPRAALWTLATLLAPFVALPLYLALRLLSRPATDLSDTPDAVTADEPAAAPDAGAETHAGILEGEGGDEVELQIIEGERVEQVARKIAEAGFVDNPDGGLSRGASA